MLYTEEKAFTDICFSIDFISFLIYRNIDTINLPMFPFNSNATFIKNMIFEVLFVTTLVKNVSILFYNLENTYARVFSEISQYLICGINTISLSFKGKPTKCLEII